jgi:hypothetical protein
VRRENIEDHDSEWHRRAIKSNSGLKPLFSFYS